MTLKDFVEIGLAKWVIRESQENPPKGPALAGFFEVGPFHVIFKLWVVPLLWPIEAVGTPTQDLDLLLSLLFLHFY